MPRRSLRQGLRDKVAQVRNFSPGDDDRYRLEFFHRCGHRGIHTEIDVHEF